MKIQLLDPEDHPLEKSAIALGEQLSVVHIAEQAGIRMAHRLIEARLSGRGNHEPQQSGFPCSPDVSDSRSLMTLSDLRYKKL